MSRYYRINKSIPIPERKKGGKRIGQTKIIPWGKMQIGDSVRVEVSSGLSALMVQASKKHNTKYFSRREGKYDRVWRVPLDF